jgi:GT2 family glycosyltransferase
VRLPITVIILTMKIAWRTKTLDMLAEGSMLPERVIVVNNSDQEFEEADWEWPFEILLLSPGRNIWIGPAQNWAIRNIRGDEDAVCFLSDDVDIRINFLERIYHSLMVLPDAGCICPVTVDTMEEFSGFKVRDDYQRMRKREGWAMTFKRSVLDQIPPVPPELKLFYSDDWFHFHTRQLGYRWYRDIGTVVLHTQGASINTFHAESKRMMEEEGAYFHRYKHEWGKTKCA